ncbi:FkbM family methyltransferase, partial [Candidatus Bathyarchaeota archaeon]
SYIDVGAWVGPTVLYGSQLSRHAYAIEPDPVAISYLRKNISLNPDLIDKISVIDYCIGSENGIVRLGTKTAGDSESSLLSIGEAKFFQVKSITFDTLIESFKINDCNFIKMDIEGGEFLILPALRRFIKKFYPTLYLSIHGFQSKRPLDYMKSISDVLSNYDYFENEQGQKIDVEELLVKKAWRQEPHAILATNR